MVDFNIISLDVSLLGSQFNASNGIGSGSLDAGTLASRGPAVITPWAEEDDRTLTNRFNQIRNRTNFINENTSAVAEAGFDKDNKALFTLYAALSDLRTIAEYASSNTTPLSLISGLSAQFQTGLAQVDDYIKQAELDKLILLAGEKKSYVTSTASLGKNDRDVEGQIIAVSETAALTSLNGDEVFTLNISNGITAGDDFVIDLSEISGTVSLSSIKDLINIKISEHNFINANGQTESTYKTRIGIEEIEDGKYGFKFNVEGIEQISLTAATADPTLIITGTSKSSEFNSVTTGTLSEYRNLDGSGVLKSYSHEIAGIDSNGFVIPATEEGEEDTPSTTVQYETTPTAIKLDSQGNAYVIGTTEGDFAGQINGAQTSDVFLSKYDSVGNLLWSRLVGASDEAEGYAIAVDADDNVVIAGKTNEELIASDVFSGTDSFVSKFAANGEELWTRQLDTISTDQANGLTVDANGDIYFTGNVQGQLNPSTTSNGATDAIVVKLGGSSGIVLETAQYGSAAYDYGKQIAIASDGNLLVIGEEDGNAVLRKLDAVNLDSTLAIYDLGDLAGGDVTGIAVDGADIYIAGSTSSGSLYGGTVSNSYSGAKDGFVTKLSDGGSGFSADWISYLGTSATDNLSGIAVSGGDVYVSGTTFGTLGGESKTGVRDGFTARLDGASGALEWQEQLGGEIGGYNAATGIVIDENGSSVLDKLGLPSGTIDRTETRDIETQTSLRAGDHFYISVNDGRNIKIDIREGDTFDRLATRINTISTRNLKASVTYGDNGPELKLEALNGAQVDLIAGADGRDALSKLGLEERSILSPDILFAIGEDQGTDPEKLGGVFALKLDNAFSFSTRQEAEFVFSQLDHALQVIESAHRSLTFDPLKAQILEDAKKNYGPPPAHLQAQLERYQDGLRRVLAVTGGTVI